VSALHFTKRTDKTADSWLGRGLASLSEKGWDRLLALAKTPGLNAERAAVAIELVVRARILRRVRGGPHGRKIYPSDIVKAGLLWKTEEFREKVERMKCGFLCQLNPVVHGLYGGCIFVDVRSVTGGRTAIRSDDRGYDDMGGTTI
jgi:hypothetical protein